MYDMQLAAPKTRPVRAAMNRRARINHSLAKAVALLVALILGFVLAGCQTPRFAESVQLPDVGAAPASQATPTASPVNADTVAVSYTESLTDAPLPEAATASVGDLSGDVSPVGFVHRLQNRCGACIGCNQGSTCNTCPEPGPMFAPMTGRIVDPQEYLCNGGDLPPEARVLQDDRVGGLQPQDAIVHYTTDAGDIHVQESNRVCVYSPRFGSVRQVTGAVAGEKAVGLRNASRPVGPTGIGMNQPSLLVQDIHELARADVSRRVDAMRDRNRGVPVANVLQPVILEDALSLLATLDTVGLVQLNDSQIAVLQRGAVAAQAWMVRDAVEVMVASLDPPVLTRDVRVESFVEYDFPDAGRLQITKVADRDHAPQGSEVTFAIYVRNVGDSAVNQVEIVDSLIPRLEYVVGSQTCDRDAVFETEINEAGSVIVKWELTEPLPVDESATIEFKCRVR